MIYIFNLRTLEDTNGREKWNKILLAYGIEWKMKNRPGSYKVILGDSSQV